MHCSLVELFDHYVDSSIYPVNEQQSKRSFTTYNIAGVECLISRRADASCWLVYSHGNGVTLDDLHDEGIATGIVERCNCNVIAPSYPDKVACGERYDCMVVSSLKSVYERIRADTDAPVYMAGRSLGVAVMLRACSSVSKLPAGIICLSGFTSISDMVPAALRPVSCLVRNRYNNCAAITSDNIVSIAKLIIHGSSDDVVPVSQALKLSEVANDSELKIIEHMGHCPGEYWPTIYSYISSFINSTSAICELDNQYPVWKSPI